MVTKVKTNVPVYFQDEIQHFKMTTAPPSKRSLISAKTDYVLTKVISELNTLLKWIDYISFLQNSNTLDYVISCN